MIELDKAGFKAFNKEYQLIDVRSEAEHNEYNIGGTNIPLDNILNELDKLDKTKPIITYCKTGARSEQAALLLDDEGFEVYNINGDIKDL